MVTAVTASSWWTADELFVCWRGAGNGAERDEGGGDGYGDDATTTTTRTITTTALSRVRDPAMCAAVKTAV